MTYSKKIRDALAEAGADGLTVSELARAVKHDAAKTSALLGALRKRGEAFAENGRWLLTGPALQPVVPEPSAVAAPVAEAEAPQNDDQVQDAVERAATACRFWVYSDRCIGISDGDAVVELDADGLRRLIEFLAGVRPLLDAEVA